MVTKMQQVPFPVDKTFFNVMACRPFCAAYVFQFARRSRTFILTSLFILSMTALVVVGATTTTSPTASNADCGIARAVETTIIGDTRFPQYTRLTELLMDRGNCTLSAVSNPEGVCKASVASNICCSEVYNKELEEFFGLRECLLTLGIESSLLKGLVAPETGLLDASINRLRAATKTVSSDLYRIYYESASLLSSVKGSIEPCISFAKTNDFGKALETVRYFIGDMLCSVCDPQKTAVAMSGDTLLLRINKAFLDNLTYSTQWAFKKYLNFLGAFLNSNAQTDGWVDQAISLRIRHFVAMLSQIAANAEALPADRVALLLKELRRVSSSFQYLYDEPLNATTASQYSEEGTSVLQRKSSVTAEKGNRENGSTDNGVLPSDENGSTQASDNEKLRGAQPIAPVKRTQGERTHRHGVRETDEDNDDMYDAEDQNSASRPLKRRQQRFQRRQKFGKASHFNTLKPDEGKAEDEEQEELEEDEEDDKNTRAFRTGREEPDYEEDNAEDADMGASFTTRKSVLERTPMSSESNEVSNMATLAQPLNLTNDDEEFDTSASPVSKAKGQRELMVPPEDYRARVKAEFLRCGTSLGFFGVSGGTLLADRYSAIFESSMGELSMRDFIVHFVLGPQLCIYDIIVNLLLVLPDPRSDAAFFNMIMADNGTILYDSHDPAGSRMMATVSEKVLAAIERELVKDRKSRFVREDALIVSNAGSLFRNRTLDLARRDEALEHYVREQKKERGASAGRRPKKHVHKSNGGDANSASFLGATEMYSRTSSVSLQPSKQHQKSQQTLKSPTASSVASPSFVATRQLYSLASTFLQRATPTGVLAIFSDNDGVDPKDLSSHQPSSTDFDTARSGAWSCRSIKLKSVFLVLLGSWLGSWLGAYQ